MVEERKNRLATEKSPYLLQHANNPVDWYPWSDEAFEKAATENKPIFLSVGYSTCHWCHVMAHESFEDPEVARLMNQTFVSVKVDREERPDIDKVFMNACQMMTGSGGWPLTIIMTPDKKPFYAATYIPKEARFDRPGMLDLIPYIEKTWKTRKDEVLKSAEKIEQALENISTRKSGGQLSEQILRLAYEQLVERFDEENGGFGKAPKFPTAHSLSFLLRYWRRSEEEKALNMVEKTLKAMRSGGIYDQIGFGFHRYSTDPSWLVPHFEKMLYDQAMLAIAYIEAYQATGKEEYATTSREILDYILRDMSSPEGGFFSGEDADSEGEEGKFYLWTQDEICEILTEEETELATNVFNISESGNYVDESEGRKTGRNILHLSESGVSPSSLETIRRKLFNRREKRIHPFKDDKILTDWNGLMIAALARVGGLLGSTKYLDAARSAADFVFNSVYVNGRLLHRYRDGKAEIEAYIDDYAFVIWGLLELYEATFEVEYLQKALRLNDVLISDFRDEQNGGFFFTSKTSERLLVRQKDGCDGAIPSGNSVSMLNLLRLGRITTDTRFEELASAIATSFSDDAGKSPAAYLQLMIALDFSMGPSYEVIVAGDSRDKHTQKILESIRKPFVPNKVLVFKPTEFTSSDITTIAPLQGYQADREGNANIFVCSGFKCQSQTSDIEQALKYLEIER